MAGLLLIIALSSIMTLFGSVVAESIAHGVCVYYISLAVCGIVLAVLWKRGIVPLKPSSILIAVGALGFIAAIVSLYIPVFSLAACALLGAVLAVCYLSSYFGIVLAKRYPSRFIMPVIMVIALITIVVHSGVLEVFRDNVQILYIIYLVVSVAMAILYLMLEPFLLYSFRGRTLQDIIGVIAEDDDEPVNLETVPAVVHTQARTPLLRTYPKTEPVPPKQEPLHLITHEWSGHERRMKALMSRAPEPLTRREYQTADGIMRGLRRSEIAKEMQILPESVTKYTNRIYDKFGIHRRQDLFKLAETLDREWIQ
jgi:DNA-binding CsgD family transcriptional regulator